MQTDAKIRNANIYPSYDTLMWAKKKCYSLGVEISDRSAELSLQSLVDHTVRRIVELQNECFVNIEEYQITAIYM